MNVPLMTLSGEYYKPLCTVVIIVQLFIQIFFRSNPILSLNFFTIESMQLSCTRVLIKVKVGQSIVCGGNWCFVLHSGAHRCFTISESLFVACNNIEDLISVAKNAWTCTNTLTVRKKLLLVFKTHKVQQNNDEGLTFPLFSFPATPNLSFVATAQQII